MTYKLTITYLDGKVESYERETKEEMMQLVSLFKEKNKPSPAGTFYTIHLPKGQKFSVSEE